MCLIGGHWCCGFWGLFLLIGGLVLLLLDLGLYARFVLFCLVYMVHYYGLFVFGCYLFVVFLFGVLCAWLVFCCLGLVVVCL